ncbi:uncharacterized protein LOC126735700 [Anthonomus grandis grandis]|uniref:uncharacterized protein LOC126735700 n=1 Tax=Anthonomus grandis grandis TaxID=2921223 RepID=UPI00216582AD|nr:uncharacterized protein LOC126735700 [Anthonomus grandis grandis]
MKHAGKVCDSTKSAHSVMFSVTAAGLLLPQYVVYKSENVWSTWTQSGPEGCIYNRSKSGWCYQSLFEDWFFNIIVPYYRHLDGPKAIIGDNLASHVSEAVIKKCKEENIRFIFLPANSTHLTQSPDVSCFRPIKIAWRQQLKKWKMSNPGVLQKDHFPRVLNRTIKSIALTVGKNIKSGFEATGLYPLNREKVLVKVPDDNETDANNSVTSLVAESVTSLFKESRFKEPRAKQINRKKLVVAPGESVTDQKISSCSESKKETIIEPEEDILSNKGSEELEDIELPCFVNPVQEKKINSEKKSRKRKSL